MSSVLQAVLVPAAVAGGWLLLVGRTGVEPVPSRRPPWAGSLAIGTAYVAGHVVLLGWPPFPPVEATQWMVYLTLASIVVGLLAGTGTPRRPRWWIPAGSWIAVTVVVLLRPMIATRWGPVSAAVWLAAVGLLALFMWIVWDLTLAPVSARVGWLALTAVAAGCSVALAASGSLALGQLAGALAAACGTAASLAFLLRGRVSAPGGAPVVAAIVTGLLIVGYFYSELPAASALLLLGAPLGMSVPSRFVRVPWGWLVRAAEALALLVALVMAVILAVKSSPPFAAP